LDRFSKFANVQELMQIFKELVEYWKYSGISANVKELKKLEKTFVKLRYR